VTRQLQLAGAFLFLLGCASGPRAPAGAQRRIQDSAPEKIAAQRNATHGLQLDKEEQRWGIEAARERRQADPKKKPSAALAP